MAGKQKWAIPFRRGRVNVEDVGYAPYYLQHDVGFSGNKIYRPVRKSDTGGFVLKGSHGMNRKEAMAELKTLVGSQQNPSLPHNKWIKGQVMVDSSGKIKFRK